VLALATLSVARPSVAQESNVAAAEAFFQDGRALYDAGKFDEACPKLAESHRLDPATGTLLALALCHEGQGRLATAWAEFTECEGRARLEGRKDRLTVATERASLLKPRLSSLAIDVPPDVAATAGLEVKLDGVVVGAPSFGVPVPIDGGEHRVDATAPGKAPWQGTVAIKVEQDAVRIAVPALPPLNPTAPAEPVAPAEMPPDPPKSSGWMSIAGLATAGAGVVALGVGGYLALDAKGDYSDAMKACGGPDGLDCPPGPYADAQDARKQGDTATIVMSIGAVVLAGGAALWFLAPKAKSEKASVSLRIDRVGVGPSGAMIRGSF